MVYADLHVHTDYSDGIHSIEETLDFALEQGIKTIAITDHDTVFHLEKVKMECDKRKIHMIPGVELSCYDWDVCKKVHVVGLWIQYDPKHIEQLCNHTLACRDAYHHELIEELRNKGFDITYSDAKKYAKNNIVFKMHLFEALVEKYPELNDLNKYRALFASKTTLETDKKMGYIDIKEGIDAIHKDGGIAILAHPCEYDNYDEIDKYVGYGIDGIEISHPSMKAEDYPKVHEYVNKYNLMCSGGSDFHNIHLTSIGGFGLSQNEFDELVKRRLKTKIRNFRDIKGYKTCDGLEMKSNKIFRGGPLIDLSSEDLKCLSQELNIKYILDFRDKKEALNEPDSLAVDMSYYNISAIQMDLDNGYSFDFGSVIKDKMTRENKNFIIDYLKKGYSIMPINNPAYKQMFNLLLENNGNVYFHCTAGKDRTGVAGFLIMMALGCKKEDAIKEYLSSNVDLKQINEELCEHLHIPLEFRKECDALLYVREEFIQLSIDTIEQTYSSYKDFFEEEYGLTEEKISKLKQIYCS